jgi:hypothetical protein
MLPKTSEKLTKTSEEYTYAIVNKIATGMFADAVQNHYQIISICVSITHDRALPSPTNINGKFIGWGPLKYMINFQAKRIKASLLTRTQK